MADSTDDVVIAFVTETIDKCSEELHSADVCLLDSILINIQVSFLLLSLLLSSHASNLNIQRLYTVVSELLSLWELKLPEELVVQKTK